MIIKTNIEIMDMPYKIELSDSGNKRARFVYFDIPDTNGGNIVTVLHLN